MKTTADILNSVLTGSTLMGYSSSADAVNAIFDNANTALRVNIINAIETGLTYVYTKTEVDALLAQETNTGISWTKAQSDANYLSATTSYFTQTQATNNFLSANTSYYTQAQVNANFLSGTTTLNSTTTQVLYNSGGTLRGSTGLTWSETNRALTAGYLLVASGVYSAAVGGGNSDAQGKNSVIIGGENNTAVGEGTIILGSQSRIGVLPYTVYCDNLVVASNTYSATTNEQVLYNSGGTVKGDANMTFNSADQTLSVGKVALTTGLVSSFKMKAADGTGTIYNVYISGGTLVYLPE